MSLWKVRLPLSWGRLWQACSFRMKTAMGLAGGTGATVCLRLGAFLLTNEKPDLCLFPSSFGQEVVLSLNNQIISDLKHAGQTPKLNLLIPWRLFPKFASRNVFHAKKNHGPRKTSYLLSVFLVDLQWPCGLGSVPELQRAIPTTRDQDVFVVLTPGHVKQTIVPVKAVPGKIATKTFSDIGSWT